MISKRLSMAVAAASSLLLLAACGSDDDSSSTTESSAVASCPTAEPAADAATEWTLDGTTGAVEVTGSTDSAAPKVTVTEPFSVDKTTVQTLTEGNGAIVDDTAEVSVCYMGVNGRDGTVFDSSYERGAPVEFPLTGVVTGFQKAIAGQKVGSTVAVAMTPDDGYGATGNPRAGIEGDDTLIFAIKILDVTG